MRFEHVELSFNDLPQIESLWMEFYLYHKNVSKHFASVYNDLDFSDWRNRLKTRTAEGFLLIEAVKDCDNNEYIAFSICTISPNMWRPNENKKDIPLRGEIDALYIKEQYRKTGIGKKLMEHAMAWMDDHNIEIRSLVVGDGNEDVLSFYNKFGFYTRITIMEQRKKQPDQR